MVMPRYCASVDQNQKEIVDAQKAIGCSVETIGRPIDLLIGYESRNYLVEIKRVGAKPRKDQQDQQDWMRDWKGQIRVCSTSDEAIRLVTRSYK